MAEQHQGVIQATINNELYEIRHVPQPDLLENDRSLLFVTRTAKCWYNKKLKQAQRLYEKNQQGRAAFMQNIGDAH